MYPWIIPLRAPSIEGLDTTSLPVVPRIKKIRLSFIVCHAEANPLVVIVAYSIHKIGYDLGARMDWPEFMDERL